MAHFNLDDYETVEDRLIKYWKDNPNGRIFTKLIEHSPSRFIVEAAIYRSVEDAHAWATGLAEETVQGRGVNATSALENCETSAIGRALANAGYASKGKRASRSEMEKVVARENTNNLIAETKAKMAQTTGEYVPVPKEDDPWTIREAQPTQTVDQAVEIVKDIIGAQTQRDIPNCKCGKPMQWRTGERTGKPWGHFKCSIWNKSTGAGCDVIHWYEIGKDGAWKPQERKW